MQRRNSIVNIEKNPSMTIEDFADTAFYLPLGPYGEVEGTFPTTLVLGYVLELSFSERFR